MSAHTPTNLSIAIAQESVMPILRTADLPEHRLIVVQWCDDETMVRLAKQRGWDGDDSLLDLVEEDEAEKWRAFDSLKQARAWAIRNRRLDLWRSPALTVYWWPNARRRSWERECFVSFRYVGGGCGWEDVT